VKWYGQYGRKARGIVKWYGNCGRKVIELWNDMESKKER
jgi:hypothetical protein